MTLGPSDEILAAWDDRRDDVSGDVYVIRVDTTTMSDVYAITVTGDSGPGSLRQALLDANATPRLDGLVFTLPGPGPHVIQPLTPLPEITAPA